MPRTSPAPAIASPSNPTLFQPLIRTAIVGAYGIGKTIEELGLERFNITVSLIRRRGIRAFSPSPEARFEAALYATNLTDELYYFGAATVGDSTGNFMTTTAPPRMYGMEFRYNFN